MYPPVIENILKYWAIKKQLTTIAALMYVANLKEVVI